MAVPELKKKEIITWVTVKVCLNHIFRTLGHQPEQCRNVWTFRRVIQKLKEGN